MNPENKESPVSFDLDEVLEIKGWLFKIVLIDMFTGKMCLKRISQDEASRLKADV